MHICISINGRNSDVLAITLDKEKNLASQVNDKVLAFIKAEVCNVAQFTTTSRHSFRIISTKDTVYDISWSKVTLWTEEELNNM